MVERHSLNEMKKACTLYVPAERGWTCSRYGLYNHFTLQFPSGAILAVYHSVNRPGLNPAVLLLPDG